MAKKKARNSRNFLRMQHQFQILIKASLMVFLASNGLNYLNFPKNTYASELLKTSQSDSPQNFISKAISRSGPAVVTIDTQRRVYNNRNGRMPPGLLIDPYFERFFNFQGPQTPRSRIENGQGSGVIFDIEGLVLTNAHVVDKSERLMVGLSDGRRVNGQVIGQDSLTDLAVIRLNESGPWPTAPLGDSDKIKVGDWAIAVGNPFGLENTVTLGIISNLNRNVSQLGISDKRINLIQTDAAINPGNSGGPLLNSKGEVIGINTLVRSGPGAGLGFAIPINQVKNIASQLIQKGKASHPIIGVSLSSMPLIDQKGNKSSESGARVRYLIPGAPGERGGLQIDDVIIAVSGELVKNPSDVVDIINRSEINKPLRFGVRRRGYKLDLFITPIDINNLNMR